jgi:hypothetical protein
MRIKSQRDFFTGLMFLLLGVAFAWGSSNYPMGSAGRMGPGYFPLMLGIILAVLGVVITIKSMVIGTPDGDPIGSFAWKPLVFIIAANLVFGVAIGGIPSIGLPPQGLIVGIFALTFVGSNAGDEFNFKEVFVLAVILSIISYAAFILLLKMQFPVWPTWFAR